MYKQSLSVLLLILINLSETQAQWTVAFEQNFSVDQDNSALKLPWAGGLNSGQYYNMDLNLDGQQDLIIFDRTSDQFVPFLSQNQEYVYAPEYSQYFPKNISSWVVVADYDGDGKQDLFTASGKRSITVYRNVSEQSLAWELVTDPLTTTGFSGFEVAIQVNPSDIPAISDIDGDGDLDIVVYNVNGRGNLEFYQNQSQDNSNKNELKFEASDNAWGGIKECGCGKFAFEGDDCADVDGRIDSTARQLHVGGKTLLAIDIDNDGDKDLLTSDEGCGELYFLENVGTSQEARFISFTTDYPESLPDEVSISFPAAFFVDATHDGIKDLVIAPNIDSEIVGDDDLTASSWLYDNVKTDKNPDFVFTSREFLQSEMIDVGTGASPILADYDADGDLDLFIGQRGSLHEDGYYASIYLYQNTGSAVKPFFTFVTSDYLELSQWKLQQLNLYFEDINADGLKDLLISGAENTFSSMANFYWIANRAGNTQLAWSFDKEERQALTLDFHPAEKLEFVDTDEDGDLDVLVAKREGNLEYYQNRGDENIPNWKLKTENAGGISSSIFSRNLAVELYDFEGDGRPDLVRSDASGTMLFYPDFIKYLEEEITVPDTIVAILDGQQKTLEVGNNLSLAAASLDGTDKTYILLGSAQGGIRLLSHTSTDSQESNTLLLFPNPTHLIKPRVKVRSSDTIRWLQMMNINGAILTDIEPKEGVKEMTIDLTALATGIYLIRVCDSTGKVSTKKLMVR